MRGARRFSKEDEAAMPGREGSRFSVGIPASSVPEEGTRAEVIFQKTSMENGKRAEEGREIDE